MIDDNTKGDQGGKKRKSYAPVVFGSKTFNPAQMEHSAHVKDFLRVYFAFAAFRHIIWGKKHPILVLTDNKSLRRFFQTKHLTPSLGNHIDFILQFNFIIGYTPADQTRPQTTCQGLSRTPEIKLTLP